jgi:hypothetical protein
MWASELQVQSAECPAAAATVPMDLLGLPDTRGHGLGNTTDFLVWSQDFEAVDRSEAAGSREGGTQSTLISPLWLGLIPREPTIREISR